MARHPDLTDADLHVPGYIQASDPGAVGAGILWADTSQGAGAWTIKIRNAADDGWELAGGGAAAADAIRRYDKYGDGSLGATFNGVVTMDMSPAYAPVSGLNVDGVNAPDSVITTFGDTEGNDLVFGLTPGTIVFTVTLTDDTEIYLQDDGAGAFLDATYNVAGTYDYASGEWQLIFSGLVPKTGTSITVDGDSYSFSTPQVGVSVADVLLFIHGGVAPYFYSISDDGWSTQTDDVDPSLAALIWDGCTIGEGQTQVWVRVMDQVGFTVEAIVSVIIQDSQGLCAGP